MNARWLRIALGTIALLMLADFVFRGIVPAWDGEKNDFAEIYVGSWLWRHGQNFYDAGLTTQTGKELAGTSTNIVLIYPPSTLVLVAPFSYFSWRVANVLWQFLELGGVVATILFLVRLAGLRPAEDRALLLGTFVLAFDPVHQAFHLGNIALVAVPLCFLGIILGEGRLDFSCGVSLAAAAALKPQLGFWVLAFYLLRLRRRVLAGALVVAIPILAVLIRFPVPAADLIAGYRHNLAYWFGPGRLYGFTEGALPFHVNICQVIFYQVLHRAGAADLLAHGLFLCGLALWGYAVGRARFRNSTILALSSLLVLTFVSLYHSVADVTVLVLAGGWTVQNSQEDWEWEKSASGLLLLLLMLPGHSALMRMTPHLSAGVTGSWWWKLLVARYFVWLLLTLNGVLLWSLLKASHAFERNDPARAMK